MTQKLLNSPKAEKEVKKNNLQMHLNIDELTNKTSGLQLFLPFRK